MELGISETIRPVLMKLRTFINEIVIPNEVQYAEELIANRWQQPPIMASMIERAKSEGLFNLFTNRTNTSLPKWSMPIYQSSWGERKLRQRCLTALHQIQEVWKCWR